MGKREGDHLLPKARALPAVGPAGLGREASYLGNTLKLTNRLDCTFQFPNKGSLLYLKVTTGVPLASADPQSHEDTRIFLRHQGRDNSSKDRVRGTEETIIK